LFAAAVLLAATPVNAQQTGAANYPDKPVKIVVSTSAGGGVDTVARLVGDRLTKILGQPFVVENRGGAGGNIGADAVYNAEPDGYTLLPRNRRRSPQATLYKKLSFDPRKLVPVAILSSIRTCSWSRTIFRQDHEEFMVYVKANPGKLNPHRRARHDLAS
jgi:tripartite-type tricarboxylate transporter receptor subunit TctC